jgi:lipopolysaccharide/colanic/teichoic acid biosynthesis glycosyltransferase
MTLRRILDLTGACLCLAMAAPLLLVTAIAIVLTDGGPVFFRQQRIGQNGRPFRVWKFRSMRKNSLKMDAVTEIRKGHPLVTPVGELIRRYKVDELPQLFNVIAGDMAMVGPRPTIADQVAKYTSYQGRRLNVRPGMTGLSQVSGGIELTWPERILLDVWYVDHWSYRLDISILLRTMGIVLFGERTNDAMLRRATDYARSQVDEAQLTGELAVEVAEHRNAAEPAVAAGGRPA